MWEIRSSKACMAWLWGSWYSFFWKPKTKRILTQIQVWNSQQNYGWKKQATSYKHDHKTSFFYKMPLECGGKSVLRKSNCCLHRHCARHWHMNTTKLRVRFWHLQGVQLLVRQNKGAKEWKTRTPMIFIVTNSNPNKRQAWKYWNLAVSWL